ncbi:MAG: CHAT domain-containing protein [Acidobacteria bacterium]|nr:CHAT domain-containing protein [Acidobacteriota bacterium]
MIFPKHQPSWRLRLASLICLLTIFSPALVVANAQMPNPPSLYGAPSSTKRPQTQRQIEFIAPGQEIAMEVQINKTHFYQFYLEAGQYAQFLVYHDSNLSATLTTPDGQRVPQSYMEGGVHATDSGFAGEAGVLANHTGTYILEVEAGRSQLNHYRVIFNIRRDATPEDRQRLAAFMVYLKVLALHQQKKAAAYLEATRLGIASLPLLREVGIPKLEARTLYYVGESFETISRYTEALEYFNQALAVTRLDGDDWLQADIFISMGQTYQYLSDYQKALESYEKGLSLTKGDNDHSLTVRAWAFDNMGVAYRSLGEKQKALSFHSKAYDLYLQVEIRGMAHALTHQAEVLASLGEKQQAMEKLERALPLWEAVPDPWGSGRVYHRLGNLYFSLGDAPQAIENFQQALQLWQQTGDQDAEADTLNSLGKVYSALGDYQKALDYLHHSLAVRERDAADHSNREGKAYSFTHIGATLYAMGNYQEALDYHLQALAIWRTIGNPNGEGYTLNYLGDAAYAAGDTPGARQYYNQSLALHRQLFDREGEASALYGLARIERDQGHLQPARAVIEEAITRVEELRISLVNQELRVAYQAKVQDYYELYIDLLMRLQQANAAGDYAARALHACERGRARSLLEMLAASGAEIREGISPALREQARTLLHDLSDKADYRNRLHSRNGSTEALRVAQLAVEAAAHAYEKVLAQIQAGNSRYAALTQPQPLTVAEMQNQLLDKDTMILEYALGRERSYLWAISATSMQSFVLPNRQTIEPAARRFYELLSARTRTIKDETATQRQARIAQADRETDAAASLVSTLILAPLANELGHKRLLIVADGALQYIPFAALPAPVPENGGAGEWRSEGVRETGRRGDREKGRKGEKKKQTKVNPVSSYSVALTPLLSHPSTPSRPVALSPLLPHAPLMVEHEIVMLPSASVLALLRQENSGRKPAPKTVAVLADPVFSKDDERVLITGEKPNRNPMAEAHQPSPYALRDLHRALEDVGEIETGHTIRRLMASRYEANRIVSFVAPEQRFLALDFQANRETAMSAVLKNFQIIHFASHAILNTTHPELSGIVLSLVDPQGRQRDGFLRAHEIYNLKLPAELVVLSACRTGLGKEVRGEGLIGLTRGFMYAGALRVVASLWAVDDKTSADLMTRVYQGMLGRQHLSPASALRAAQLEMWKSNRWPSPYFWAGFILQGEWK